MADHAVCLLPWSGLARPGQASGQPGQASPEGSPYQPRLIRGPPRRIQNPKYHRTSEAPFKVGGDRSPKRRRSEAPHQRKWACFAYPQCAISAPLNLVLSAGMARNLPALACLVVIAASEKQTDVSLEPSIRSPYGPEGFGSTIAFSGDSMLVALSAAGLNGSQGGVFLYSRSGGSQLVSLNSSTSPANSSRLLFGRAVALDTLGELLVVGSNSSSGGAVHLFSGSSDISAKAMELVQSIDLPDGVFSDCFGCSVTLDGKATTLAVGAPGRDINGNVFVFACHEGTCSPNPTSSLRPSSDDDRTAPLNFGFSVAFNRYGRVLAIGSPQPCCDGNARNSAGVIYISSCEGDGQCSEPAPLGKPAAEGSYVGHTVALSDDGTFLVFGAYGRNGWGAVLTCRVASCDTPALLVVPDLETGDSFGFAVATAANGALMAASAPRRFGVGAVYVFSCTPATGSCMRDARAVLAPARGVPGGSFFGGSLALGEDGAALVIGAAGFVFNASNVTAFLASMSASSSPSPAPTARPCETACVSRVCAPENGACCANPDVRHELACGPDGLVQTCESGFIPSIDRRSCGVAPGSQCSRDADCASLACRTGFCCDPFSSAGCAACSSSPSGDCITCDAGLTLMFGLCKPPSDSTGGDGVSAAVAATLGVVVLLGLIAGGALR